MPNEDSLLNSLQNGIPENSKLELLKSYGSQKFDEGYNFCLQIIRKNKETRKSRLSKEASKLLDELREEIDKLYWSKEEGHIADRKYENKKI